jgi:hypothetical protein
MKIPSYATISNHSNAFTFNLPPLSERRPGVAWEPPNKTILPPARQQKGVPHFSHNLCRRTPLLSSIRIVLGSNLILDTAYRCEGFRGFPQPFQPNVGIALQLGHNRFLPSYFQPIIHLSYNSTSCSLRY